MLEQRLRLMQRLIFSYTLLFQSFSLSAADFPSDLDELAAPSEQKRDIRPSDVIHWQVDHAEAYGDNTVMVALRLETEQGFTLYTDKVNFESPSGYWLVDLQAPPSEELLDPLSGEKVQVYTGGEFFLLFSGLEPFKAETFPVSVRFLSCTKSICLFPFTQTLDLPTFFSKEAASPLFAAGDKIASAAASLRQEATSTQEAGLSEEGSSLQGWQAEIAAQVKAGHVPLLWLLVLLFIGGLLTNLTPCVYPMIPITIRILAGQARSPFAAASAYAGGIVATYTLLGLFAAYTGSMFGQFMASPLLNSFFAAVMALLALSMLGFGSFTRLQNLGQKVASKKAGLKNAFLMGAGAGLVASPCTGPILAALLAYTASQKEATAASLLLFIYSLGFALPYLVLGSASARLAQIRVGLKTQLAIKLMFSAVLFGLSLYYLRIPLYSFLKGFDGSSWTLLAAASAFLGVGAVIVLLRQHDWQHKKSFMLLPALLFGMAVFATSQQLGSKPSSSVSEKELPWLHDEDAALQEARKMRAPLLIDMWAEWCEACKKLDRTTFADAPLKEMLRERGWVLLKLDLTEASEKNDMIQLKYGVKGLPTLILIPDPNQPEQRQSIVGYTSAEALRRQLMQMPPAGG